MKNHKLKTLIKTDKLLRKNGGHMLRSKLKTSLKNCSDDTLSELIYNQYLDYYRDGTDGEIYMTDKGEEYILNGKQRKIADFKLDISILLALISLLFSILNS